MPSSSEEKIKALKDKISKAKGIIKDKRTQIAEWEAEIKNIENAAIATKVREVGVPLPEICSLLNELKRKNASSSTDGSDDI